MSGQFSPGGTPYSPDRLARIASQQARLASAQGFDAGSRPLSPEAQRRFQQTADYVPGQGAAPLQHEPYQAVFPGARRNLFGQGSVAGSACTAASADAE